MNKKLLNMFEIQDELNKKIAGENYKNLNIPFYRAAAVEAGELMEHRGYKWWKKIDNYDVDQAHLEIVDIWHFLMSHLMSNKIDINKISVSSFSSTAAAPKEGQLKSIDEFLHGLYSDSDILAITTFINMCNSFGLSFDSLYKQYIGKNALNIFRQENGYKEGTYNKNNWIDSSGNFVEDNIILAEILNGDSETLTEVCDELYKRYNNTDNEVGC